MSKSESDSDSDSEEILVYADFENCVGKDELELRSFKIVGVESERPVLQVGGRPFAARHADRAGTLLFFEDDPDPPDRDPLFDEAADSPLRYSCKTTKGLACEKALLRPKDEGKAPAPEPDEAEDAPDEPVARSVEEAIERLRLHVARFPCETKPPPIPRTSSKRRRAEDL